MIPLLLLAILITLLAILITLLHAWSLALAVDAVLLVLIVTLFLVGNVVYSVRHWQAGRKGLNQWPKPHGRYYDEWLALPAENNDGNYYEWLARKMGQAEPWRTWARAEAALEADKLGSARSRLAENSHKLDSGMIP